jgi:hypothetical protein
MKVTPVKKKFGSYQPGQEFEFPDKLARVLIRIGKLREVTAPAPDVGISPRTGQPKRQYQRRDMKAQD